MNASSSRLIAWAQEPESIEITAVYDKWKDSQMILSVKAPTHGVCVSCENIRLKSCNRNSSGTALPTKDGVLAAFKPAVCTRSRA